MAYFKYFPKIMYDIRGLTNDERYDTITNILVRVLVHFHGWEDVDSVGHEVLVGAAQFEKHIITDGEKPETLADQYYGDAELHWLILYVNGSKLLNPYYDWPMNSYDLKKFCTKKYADINGTHHYVDTNNYEVDSDAPNASVVTNFGHEELLNDGKRVIRVLHPQYVSLVVEEFTTLISQQ
jgi:hypothetical protein